jgi:hypothetical protein
LAEKYKTFAEDIRIVSLMQINTAAVDSATHRYCRSVTLDMTAEDANTYKLAAYLGKVDIISP